MGAKTPQEAHKLFVTYFNQQDLDALLSLYEPNATLVPFPGPPVQGLESIREVMKGFLALKGHMDLAVDKVFQADDIGLLFSSWNLQGTDPEGSPLVMSGQTSDVVRRQPDGTWLFVIDNPQGAAATKDAESGS